MQSDLVAAAQRLIDAGRVDNAVALIVGAAESGDAHALLQLAMWRLAGNPVPRDLLAARTALRKSAERGNLDAHLLETALTANGSGGPADWKTAVRELERINTNDEYISRLRVMLDAMQLDDEGAPVTVPAPIDLTSDGTVRRLRGFLSPSECAHIAHSVSDILAPADVIDPRSGRQIAHPVRTSDSAVIGPIREDLVIRAVNRRIAVATQTDIDQGEALTVLRYSPGQQFRMHVDTLPAVRNQRVKTVLIYLNQGFRGGETVFPDHHLSESAITGDAIIFDNVTADGNPDQRSRHAGLPVIQGVKWLATRWIRARPYSVWSGPESV